MWLVELLNKYSGAVNAVLTLVLVFATSWYVRLTSKLVRESVALREASGRPRMFVSIVPHEAHISLLMLRISNTGGGSAHNISFEPSRRIYDDKVDVLAGVAMFEQGLTYLAPHQSFELILVNAIGNLEELKKEVFSLSLRYSDDEGRQFAETFTFDFGQFEGISQAGEPPLYELASAVKKLQEDFRHALGGFKKISVLSYSPDDLERERSANHLWYKFSRVPRERRTEVERLLDSLAPQPTTPPKPEKAGDAGDA